MEHEELIERIRERAIWWFGKTHNNEPFLHDLDKMFKDYVIYDKDNPAETKAET